MDPGTGPDACMEFTDVVHTSARSRQVLYLFSDSPKSGHLGEWLMKLGYKCDMHDYEAASNVDLRDHHVWDIWADKILKGFYSAIFCSPHFSTFEGEKAVQLRAASGKDLYGRPSLDQKLKEEVRLHNWLAIMTTRICQTACQKGIPFGVLSAARRDSFPSLFNLHEMALLASAQGVTYRTFLSCCFGFPFSKKFEILGTFDLNDKWQDECQCPSKWWVQPSSGDGHFGPHPPEMWQQAIPREICAESAANVQTLASNYQQQSEQQFYRKMNRELALAIAVSVAGCHVKPWVLDSRVHSYPNEHPVIGVDLAPVKRARLTGPFPAPSTGKQTETDFLGGLRNGHLQIRKNQRMLNLGVLIRNFLDHVLDSAPQVETALLDSIGAPLGTSTVCPLWVDETRVGVAKLIARHLDWSLVEGSWGIFNEGVATDETSTCLKHAFMKLWAQAVQDPAARIVDWLQDGAPAGLVRKPELDGIWPIVEDDEAMFAYWDLQTDLDIFQNYKGVEDNPAAQEAIQGYVDKGFLKSFGTLDECIRALKGSTPVLSKLGCITKTRPTPDGGTVTKHRIILDAKQSQVTRATDRTYRSVLPRLSDAVNDALQFSASLDDGELVEMLIADISDAFWLFHYTQTKGSSLWPNSKANF